MTDTQYSDKQKVKQNKNVKKKKKEVIFENKFDFLIFKMLNLLTANDKPFFFMFPIIALSLINFYFSYTHPVHLSISLFFCYQYVCGNSFITCFKDSIFYFTIISIAALLHYSKMK